MNTLLIVAIVVTTLAVLVQAGVLASMYFMSRRVTTRVEGLISETQRIIAPMEVVGQNLKATSEDLVEVGKAAREEIQHLQLIVQEVGRAVTQITADVRSQVSESVDEVRTTVMSPIRQWSAIAQGVSEGLRVFFRRRESVEPPQIREDSAA